MKTITPSLKKLLHNKKVELRALRIGLFVMALVFPISSYFEHGSIMTLIGSITTVYFLSEIGAAIQRCKDEIKREDAGTSSKTQA